MGGLDGGKRGIRTVTVQSLARRTRELEEFSGRREEGERAEVLFWAESSVSLFFHSA